MTKFGAVIVNVFFLVIAVDVIVEAEHFRGGSMSWRMTDEGELEVSYRLAWKADTDEGEHNCTWARVNANTLVGGNTGGIKFNYTGMPTGVWATEYPLDYHCTARHEASDYPQSLDRSWVMGENKKILPIPPDAPSSFQLIYSSCCWVHTLQNYEVPRSWDFVMQVDLTPREATHTVNHSPITNGLPVQRVSQGCRAAVLNIPTYDADGDDVRCRWIDGNQGECRSNCDVNSVWPQARWRLQNRDAGCRLVLFPRSAAVGWYAVAIMIEDSTNGVVHSKVPFQYMLEITGDPTCSLPVLVGPATDSCWMLPVGQTFSFNITAKTVTDETSIRDITTTNVRGMQKSPLRQAPDNPLEYYVTMTWTPGESDRGVSLFCFQPEDSAGFQGNQACIDISVGDEQAPVPDEFISYPGSGYPIHYEDTAFELVFDDIISRPSQDSEIRILHASDKSLLYSVKVEPAPGSDGVMFQYNAILFSIPDDLLVANHTYTLDLPEGLARGLGTCEPWSKATAWNFATSTGYQPGNRRPPSDLFLPAPQCFGTFMQIFVPKTMVPMEDPSNMHFNEPTCVGREHNGTHFVMGTSYQYCGTHIRPVTSERKSIISNTILISEMTAPGHQKITRHGAVAINVVCEMANDKTTFVEFDAELPAVVFNRSSTGRFNFSLRMYPNESYAASYNDYPLEVGLENRLFFEAKVLLEDPENTLSGQRILLRSCEATPTPNPIDRQFYRFIENGCALDETVMFHNQARLKTRFSIQAFAFLDHFLSNAIFVHCDIGLQANNDDISDADCPLSNAASSRRRRSADSSSQSHASFNTDGPIRIVGGFSRDKSAQAEKSLSQSPLGSIYVSATAIILCIVLVAVLISMVTVMRRLKIENRRLGKFVGHPSIRLESITHVVSLWVVACTCKIEEQFGGPLSPH